eukprot:gnl/TRDRNA2_/TRDRNA2_32991_c0_seq1.p1 gnl/TRDRNA2_/TRDRNA2_32991_c0~~gnl/TRDRNA2_/TRDRNA2_32991_c0_seq1.p1  ORF type:complete len:187 (+),score=22.84 gnl/TRDRNA2_/TRDRNA2_32991_c0_seq1:742-1302(+)
MKSEQRRFIEEALTRVTRSTPRLIVLTHIPPFMSEIDEGPDGEPGWANWKKGDRHDILDLITNKLKAVRPDNPAPLLFVCGHFHANANQKIDYSGVEVQIVVTSAAGTTIQWDGLDELSPKHAAAVASKPIIKAFPENVGFNNIDERLQAVEQRSGMTVFTVTDDGKVTHKWQTVKEYEDEATGGR